jgi:rare lipoprotein A
MRQGRTVILSFVGLVLTACAGGGAYFEKDGPHRRPKVNIATIPEPTPRPEPLSASGNRPYTVMGQTYYPVSTASGYRERGSASWYGKMFHGRRTSSGEPYDMYAMTAAHRTLPLPCYVRVTNLANGRSVVVRVNDRGPFLHGRVIDLSYAAAARLDMVASGTATVEVVALTPWEQPAAPAVKQAKKEKKEKPEKTSIAKGKKKHGGLSPVAEARAAPAEQTSQWYVQVGAFAQHTNALELKQRLQSRGLGEARIAPDPDTVEATANPNALFRVQLGPLASRALAEQLSLQLTQHGFAAPHIVTE